MKYQQPFGTVDGSPYINGNPATGTQGSIPPAESIEHPQRELVDLIAKEGLVPSSLDLGQLAKAIQLGKISYGNDTGSSNALEVSLVPIPGSVPGTTYQAGFPVIVRKIPTANTSTTPTLNVNGLGPKPIVNIDGSALPPGAMIADGVFHFVYDGQKFRLMGLGPQSLTEIINERRPYFCLNTSASGESGVTYVPNNTWTVIQNLNVVRGSYFYDSASRCTSSRFVCGPLDAGMWYFTAYAGMQDAAAYAGLGAIARHWIQPRINGEFAEGGVTNDSSLVGFVHTFPLVVSGGMIIDVAVHQGTGVTQYVGNCNFTGIRQGHS